MSQPVPASYQVALTSRRSDLGSLPSCFAEFMRHFSPRLAAIALVLAAIARIYVGGWSWRDAVVPVGLLAAQPFVEWVIHRYLLHLKPRTVLGIRIDHPGARQHREHHRHPSDLPNVLLKPVYITQFVIEIAILAPLVVWPLVAVSSGSLLPVGLTAITLSYAGLLRYEWSHFLIHTPYVPKSRWYRAIWRNHRLHHYKHEDYWLGITSNLGDRLLGTNPDQSGISRSPTARTLGVED